LAEIVVHTATKTGTALLEEDVANEMLNNPNIDYSSEELLASYPRCVSSHHLRWGLIRLKPTTVTG